MRALLIALVLALPAAPLPAQTTAALRALWAEFPALPPGERVEIGFGDLRAARDLDVSAVEGAQRDPALLALRAVPAGPWQQSVGGHPHDGWRGAVGFAPSDVLRLASLSAPPVQASVIELAPGASAAVPPALAARGYAETPRFGLTAWARGAEDFGADLRARDPNDPFDGGLGRSSRVQVQGDRLRQAVAWPVLAALGGSPGLTDGAHVAALLGALDRITGAGPLIGATLWTDAGGLGLSDPLEIATGRAAPPAGPPVAWGMALFADLSDGADSTAVLALTVTLPDAATAERLRARVEAAWSDRRTAAGTSFAGLTGGPLRASMAEAAPGLWVLALAQTRPTEVYAGGLTRNATLDRLLRGAMMRDLVFLMP